MNWIIRKENMWDASHARRVYCGRAPRGGFLKLLADCGYDLLNLQFSQTLRPICCSHTVGGVGSRRHTACGTRDASARLASRRSRHGNPETTRSSAARPPRPDAARRNPRRHAAGTAAAPPPIRQCSSRSPWLTARPPTARARDCNRSCSRGCGLPVASSRIRGLNASNRFANAIQFSSGHSFRGWLAETER